MLRDALASDWAEIRGLLDAPGLPTDDLQAASLQGFLVATTSAQSGLKGVIGCQCVSPDTGLLRSLVVAAAARRSGLGSQLVLALEAAAVSARLRELWLLTIDADGFFARHGYVVAERNTVPDTVQRTPDFSSLCPGDAFVTRKSIANE